MHKNVVLAVFGLAFCAVGSFIAGLFAETRELTAMGYFTTVLLLGTASIVGVCEIITWRRMSRRKER